MIKIVTVVGARPQFIKAATVTRAISHWNRSSEPPDHMQEVVVHTGQHYDANMSAIFFQELRIPEPQYNLGVGSDTHGRQTGKMLSAIEDVLMQEKPDLVLVYGDTNSTLAGVLAAAKLHIPTAHVEAGLRSYNRKMPEEVNRLVADELSQILFCPTVTALENLRREGIVDEEPRQGGAHDLLAGRRVFLVGDVMVDSVLFNSRLAGQKSAILRRLGMPPRDADHGHYVLVTLHRPENVDDPNRLEEIVKVLAEIAKRGLPVVFPVHPRTRCRLHDANKKSISGVKILNMENVLLCEPLGYLDMLQLQSHAFAVMTDSGGIQKEAFILGTPCITLRRETEWIETVERGWNILVGVDANQILLAINSIADWKRPAPPFPSQSPVPHGGSHPFGDGHAAKAIARCLAECFGLNVPRGA